MEAAVEVASRMGLPLVATSDAHYVRQEDADAQDVLLCINTGKFRTDTNRMKMEGDQFFLRSPERNVRGASRPGRRARSARRKSPTRSTSTSNSASGTSPRSRCPTEKNVRRLPARAVPRRAEGTLRRRAAALERRRSLAGSATTASIASWASSTSSGFCDYFLIVWDFVRFAVEKGIPCTARGSGVGSLVCYALEAEPRLPAGVRPAVRAVPRREPPGSARYRHRLLQGAPRRSHSVRQGQVRRSERRADRHVRHARRAGGDSRRRPHAGHADLPRRSSRRRWCPISWASRSTKALESSDELKKAYEADPEVRELIDLARKIEGLARNVGTHAAAVVIAEKPVDEYVPLQHVKGKTEVITQWAMGDVEAAGLLKMDFLGLRNLTILARSVELDRAIARRADRSLQVSARRQGNVRPALPRRNQGHLPARKRRHSRPACSG